jgi:heme A synthase
MVVLGLFLTQITVGVVNLALLAPVWAQLVHLLLADAVWLSVVWLGMTALQPSALAEAQPSPKITTAT